MSTEQLQLILTALMPYIAVIVLVYVQTRKFLKEFNALRADVKDEKTINILLEEGKKMAAMYRSAYEQIQELTKQLQTLAIENENLASELKRQNREV